MNITQVYLTPDYDTTEDNIFRVKYQNQTTYLQLFIEDCLRRNKLDLGKFNRLIFSEGGDDSKDFYVVGNNALPVAIEKTYEELDTLNTNREYHNYFVVKFLEGFKKFDANFSTSITEYLAPLIENKYENELFYEKNMATNRVGGYRVQAIGCYSKDWFRLIINIFKKNKLLKSNVVFECEPDMFIVKYDVYKVEITDVKISVINKIREKTLELKIEDVI